MVPSCGLSRTVAPEDWHEFVGAVITIFIFFEVVHIVEPFSTIIQPAIEQAKILDMRTCVKPVPNVVSKLRTDGRGRTYSR